MTTASDAGQPEFKDRRGGLVAFGILQTILGALCALMAPIMLLSMMATAAATREASGPQVDSRMMLPAVLLYAGLAVWFVWVGIGSIMARRWARALILVTSWMWLVGGVMALVAMVLFLPAMYARLNQNGQMPQVMMAIIQGVTYGIMVLFYVVLPGILVLFYRSRHVKATCEAADEKVRWTDRCPLPVLAISLGAAFFALCMPTVGFYGWTAPLFGTILTGAAGAAVVLVTAALAVYVAWGAYRLDVKAWWCAVAVVIWWGASACVTFSRSGLMAYYEKMNFPAEQLEMMRQIMPPDSTWMTTSCILWSVVLLGYLVWTRKFFRRVDQPAQDQRPSASGWMP